MPSSEKRRTLRIQPYVAPCRVVAGGQRFPGYLTDLSTKGARVSCDLDPPPAGVPVVLEVRFGRQVRYSRLPAEVKWTRPPGEDETHTLGLTFEGVTAEEQEVLEAIVREFQRRAEQLA